ncbi:MAG: glycosyltransferase [Actinobacteria bacterium]|nr:glycosyltransferase [Actinomycetota bacterium]
MINNKNNTSETLISVIVPANNEEKFIASCLTNLINQDFNKDNYEIIVIDNASTDNTANVTKKFKVNLIYEAKKGYNFALIRGFLEAKGEIVAITDADTEAPFDWLSKIYKAFGKNPKFVMVCGRSIIRPKTFLSCISEFFINLGGGIIMKISPSYNLAIRREVYFSIGGINKNLELNLDTDLCLRAKGKGKTVFLWNNPVTTSSRHYKGIDGIKYCFKGIINLISLKTTKKTFFRKMVDIRG